MTTIAAEPRTFAVYGDADREAILVPASSFEDAAVTYLEHADPGEAEEILLHVQDTETGVELRFRADLAQGVITATA